MSLRKAIKTRGAFPSEDAALKVMYLALRNLAARWKHVQGWREALNRFTCCGKIASRSTTLNQQMFNHIVYTNYWTLPTQKQ